MQIGIPFIDQVIGIELPPANLLFDISPKDIPPVKDFKAAICQALQNPIGAPPLNELLQPGWKVTLVSDDNTRPTPVDRIMPIVLDVLNQSGIPDAQIEIIISSGTHRGMTQAELAAKYGQELLERVRVLPHHYLEPGELVNFGVTRRGVPIWVNRRVVEADFCMAVGNIVPHHPAGWSGGAKAVLPGVAGEETVAQMHLLGSRHPALGEVDSEMRREMEDFAAVIGLDFILNVILNRSGDLVGAVAGHFIAAHRAGVQISKDVYGVPVPDLANLTISSTSPVDFDFFQGDKGITSAEKSTQPGGEILLVSGCLEGISPAHPELADYVGRLANDQIWQLLAAHQAPDPLTAAEAIVINDIMAKMKISIVTKGISPDACRSMGMLPIVPEDLSRYLAGRIQSNPALKIGILRKSSEILPYLE
jgi:nickel-dependent lactate racemase